jgi:hypothetical protein
MRKGKPYRIEAEAWRDVEEAADWYDERSGDASAAFLIEVIEAFETICDAPQRWPEYLHEPAVTSCSTSLFPLFILMIPKRY